MNPLLATLVNLVMLSTIGLRVPDEQVEIDQATYGSLTGIVLDTAGRPIPKFRILIECEQRSKTTEIRYESTHGTFRLIPLPAGRCRLSAFADGHASSIRFADVELGHTTGPVEFRLPPLGSVRVLVREADTGKPIPNANVFAYGDALIRNPDRDSGTGTTDEKGVFEIAPTAPGSLHVSIGHAVWPEVSREIEVAEGVDTEVVVLMQSGGTIRGKIPNPVATNTTVIRVHPKDWAAAPHQFFTREFEIDEEGRFEARGIEPGEVAVYTLSASDPSALLGFTEVRAGETTEVELLPVAIGTVRVYGRVSVGGRPAAGLHVSVHAEGHDGDLWKRQIPPCATSSDGSFSIPDAPAGPAEIRMGRLRFPLTIPDEPEFRHDIVVEGGGRVTGTVVRKDDRTPVARVMVGLEDRSRYPAPWFAYEDSATTDASGRFELIALESGPYHVRAAPAPRGFPASGTENLIEYVSSPLRLTDGREHEHDVELVAGGIARVTVDAPGSSRIPEAARAVSLYRIDGDRMSDHASYIGYCGIYSVATVRGIEPGRYLVSAFPYAASDEQEITVRTGATRDVRLTLRPSTHVSIRAVDEGGNPVYPKRYRYQRSDGREMLLRSGSVALEPGLHRVTVSADGYEDTTASFKVAPGANAIVEVRLTK